MSAMLRFHLVIGVLPFQSLGGVGVEFPDVPASTVVNLDGPMLVVPLVSSSGSISPSLAEAGSVASGVFGLVNSASGNPGKTLLGGGNGPTRLVDPCGGFAGTVGSFADQVN